MEYSLESNDEMAHKVATIKLSDSKTQRELSY